MLSFVDAVIPSKADVIIFRKEPLKLSQGIYLSFLGAEYLEVMETDELGDDRSALTPAVTTERITAVFIADVERTDLHGGDPAGYAATGQHGDCKRYSQQRGDFCDFHYDVELICNESKVNKY